ncbi:XrtA system polysaccharide chain length determinant [Pseudomaricurvus sp. HS19]|uniref:XrtA system polysaccharide chain length determinant n=1 Tax=Pseudomaricurvus sp. HS19 TaxID=2692626 RepID=UPI00136C7AED|nr:XrtA system polysaccharide chain length determinant [Pseudomaricurvus sp. HS19]MYM62023.1 chain length-determining protein [Pseudomaricurvus sp. HS19]
MQQLLAQAYGYLLGVWRFRWPALGIAWAFALVGWLWVWSLPESYLATARLDVDSRSILRPLLRGLAIQPDLEQRVALMSKTLLSRPNLEKLMRMADLDLKAKSDLQEERMLNELRSNITLNGDRRNSSLYYVSFRHEDRDTAKRVVQSLITIFIESALGDKRKDSSGAQAFLDQQIEEYELRLSQAEKRLADFKQQNAGQMPGEAGSYYVRLESERSKLKSATLELKELENRKAELNRQLQGEEPAMFSNSLSGASLASPLDQRINALQEKLDSLTVNYTELHPSVIQLKDRIRALQRQRERDLKKAMEERPASFAGLDESPVYQSMRTMLAETEARIAEVSVRVEEFGQRVKSLEDAVNSIPDIEVELQQLDRDYRVVSQQHDALLKRRESAMLSEKVEKTAEDIKFRVVDPPYVPLKPTEPNKLLLNAMVLVLSLGISGGVALLISLIKPVFVDRHTVTEKLGLPVLGCVTVITTPEQEQLQLRNTIMFGSGLVSLVVVFAGVSAGQGLIF